MPLAFRIPAALPGRISEGVEYALVRGGIGALIAAPRYNRSSGENLLAGEKLYKAEYLGSGTFVISKPKRAKRKVRQSSLKNPQRGSRK